MKLFLLFYNFDTIQFSGKGDFYRIVDETLLVNVLKKACCQKKHEKKFIGKRITKDILLNLKKLILKNYT